MPRVSVIMNCYNGEKYLREAIDSVYAQTFTDWEIIFWDNASTDLTATIARSYDGRIRYFRSNELTTLGAARQQAVAMAKGEWIAFLDCDDLWVENKLQTQIDALVGSDCILCYAGVREITPDGKMIREVLPEHGSGHLLEKLLLQFDVNMVTPIIRADALSNHCLTFDLKVTASEEYNLFVRLAAKGKVLALSEILGIYRVCAGSLTDRQTAQWSVERRYTLDQLKKENPGIEQIYPKAFREAYARGEYYKARYLMTENRVAEAKHIMANITEVDIRYKLLWILLFLPGCWSRIHDPIVRRHILTLLNKIKQTNIRRTK